jgi:hypothetical protein
LNVNARTSPPLLAGTDLFELAQKRLDYYYFMQSDYHVK